MPVLRKKQRVGSPEERQKKGGRNGNPLRHGKTVKRVEIKVVFPFFLDKEKEEIL